MAGTTLCAEDLALIVLADRRGFFGSGQELDLMLSGALLADLVAEGHAELRTRRDDVAGKGTIRLLGGEPPSDPLLAQAWTSAENRRARSALRRGARQARARVYARLAEREVVSLKHRRVLAPRPTLIAPPARDRVRQRLYDALVTGVGLDPVTVSLLWIADAGPGLPKVLPDIDRSRLRAARKQLPKRDWVARAVKTEIDGNRAAAAT